MNKEEKINEMLDNAVKGLNHASDTYSRLGKITTLMSLIKHKSSLVRDDPRSHDSMTYCDGFLDGYESRIDYVWHNELKIGQPQKPILVRFKNGLFMVFEDIRELKGIESDVEMFAYLEDLIPNTED